MGIVRSYLASAQNPVFGISRVNIVSKLTQKNWQTKAIVRAGVYIWIEKCKLAKHEKTEYTYSVQFWGKIKDKDFEELKNALEDANQWADHEGVYPSEFEPGWTVSSINKRS